MEYYYNNEFDSLDDDSNKNNDLIITIYYTKNTNKYAKHIDLPPLVDSENNKEHVVYKSF